MKKFEDSSLNEENGLNEKRKGLGMMKRGQPTPDLPEKQGGDYILFSKLHLVSIKHPGDESPTTLKSCHVNQHCGHRPRSIGGSTSPIRRRREISSPLCLYHPAQYAQSPPKSS